MFRLVAQSLKEQTAPKDRMSQLLIQQYLNQLTTLKKVSGSMRETVLREAFKDLLKSWGKQHDLVFIPEYKLDTLTKDTRFVDGALLYELRVPFGYWEAKDTNDDLDDEIAKKFKRGYPQDNIIFEDTVTAVLIQNKQEVMRAAVDNTDELKKLLECFFRYERREITQFKHAVTQFKSDLPAVLEALRAMIEKAHADNKKFRQESERFLAHAQEAINPSLSAADVREMLIQHVLTEEIFSTVFPNASFHRENNIARELYKLEATFFTGNTKFQTLKALEPYYAAIRAAAAQIERHNEKQAFLKALYENFYKVYNVKAADRLGVVYTPNEIVRFMIESADWLTQKHFGMALIDKDVEILDPATGTGTFICELLEHFRGQPKKLEYKYEHELHANEVAILPYYVANLNIEATYAALMGDYKEFPNLCFVDTLDNVAALSQVKGQTGDLLGSVTEENVVRIKRQNARKISVVIGNPPYNANQLNENDNNKNREYPNIDKRIKATYIAESTAQKTKGYDMYRRFFRWASDRLAENGVIAFVTNSNFIDAKEADGFRKVVAKEFNEIWVINLKGNARTTGERRRREGGNIFLNQIRVGIAVYFCVKRRGASGCRIFYDAVRDYAKADEKQEYLTTTPLGSRSFTEIRPDQNGNWIDLADTDFDKLLPLASKQTKAAKNTSQEKAIFKLFSLGVSTNRDDWVYCDDKSALEKRMRHFIRQYEAQRAGEEFSSTLKWSRNLKRRFAQNRRENFDADRIVRAAYRPFYSPYLYDSDLFIDEGGSKDAMFPVGQSNRSICFSDAGARTDYVVIAVSGIADLHFGSSIDAFQQVPQSRFDTNGTRVENVTDWALSQFQNHYESGRSRSTQAITREAIFYYVYAVLHDPIYREKYALNLKREFPHIPMYGETSAAFWQWASWGEELMGLHIDYEHASPARLNRIDGADDKARKNAGARYVPKPLLKADIPAGRIVLDSATMLDGIPDEAWKYKLGNRSALEWILDQYKEKKPKDPTIREKFDTYRFADYKDKVIDLIARVTRVSVETVRITESMKKAAR